MEHNEQNIDVQEIGVNLNERHKGTLIHIYYLDGT